MNLDLYKKAKIIGGGCSCPNRPNCGHYVDLASFAMKGTGRRVQATLKAAEGGNKKRKKGGR